MAGVAHGGDELERERGSVGACRVALQVEHGAQPARVDTVEHVAEIHHLRGDGRAGREMVRADEQPLATRGAVPVLERAILIGAALGGLEVDALRPCALDGAPVGIVLVMRQVEHDTRRPSLGDLALGARLRRRPELAVYRIEHHRALVDGDAAELVAPVEHALRQRAAHHAPLVVFVRSHAPTS